MAHPIEMRAPFPAVLDAAAAPPDRLLGPANDAAVAEPEGVRVPAAANRDAAGEEVQVGGRDALLPPHPPALGPYAPGRMTLSEEEHTWALQLKAAIAADPEVDGSLFSDFWCAHLAIVDRGDLDASMDRVRQLQAFRQEYGISETVESGNHFMTEMINLFPGFHLSLSYNLVAGNYVLMLDLSKFFATKLRSQHGAKHVWLTSFYYLNHSLNPDFEAIRKGCCMVNECDGFDWKTNYGMKEFNQLFQEIAGIYPTQFQQIKYYNTGLFIRLLMTMVKKISPPEFHSKFQFGCVMELGRLDRLMLVPNMEMANDRLLNRFRDALHRRYLNEANFTL